MNFERYLRYTWEQTHHLEQSPRSEHRSILALCEMRDVERACDLLRKHVLGHGRPARRQPHAEGLAPPAGEAPAARARCVIILSLIASIGALLAEPPPLDPGQGRGA
jgi:hypothetical protein